MATYDGIDQTVAIKIPNEQTLSRSGASTISVPVPVSAGNRRGMLMVIGSFLLLMGVVSLLGCVAISLSWLAQPLSASTLSISTIFAPISLLFGVLALGSALTCISDAALRSPVLEIDFNGLKDTRSACFIEWTAVASVTITYQSKYTTTGVVGIEMQLRQAVHARHNPFRLGTLGFSWRRRDDCLNVPLLLLSASPHMLAHAAVALFELRSGGK